MFLIQQRYKIVQYNLEKPENNNVCFNKHGKITFEVNILIQIRKHDCIQLCTWYCVTQQWYFSVAHFLMILYSLGYL
jgi:hypothetical protein